MPRKPLVFILIIVLFISIGALYKVSGAGKTGDKEIFASGTIEASEIDLAAEVPGKLKEIKVEEGQKVKVGDILAKLDSSVYDLQVKQNEALVAAAKAKARETKSGSRDELIKQAEANVQQVAALVNGAKTMVRNAEANYQRIKALYKTGAATEQQLDNAEAQLQNVKAQLEAYVSQMNAARQQLSLLRNGATAETINMADAGVAQAQAALEMAKVQQLKTIITSPVDGVVSSVNFKEGEFAAVGASVVTLLQPENLWVQVYIPEKDIPKIKLGQKALISIDAYPDQSFAGEVSYISPEAEFTPKNLQTKEERVKTVFAVKIQIKEGIEKFKPGLPADITIKL
ncbi:HlyD family secretion protein [Thermincola ferriacetica]